MLACVCGVRTPMSQAVQTEKMREDIERTYVRCPACGVESTAYLMTPALHQARQKLQMVLMQYQRRRNQQNWDRYQTAKAAFQRQFDAEQRRLRRKYGLDKEQPGGASVPPAQAD